MNFDKSETQLAIALEDLRELWFLLHIRQDWE